MPVICARPLCFTIKYNTANTDLVALEDGKPSAKATAQAKQQKNYQDALKDYKAKLTKPEKFQCDPCKCFPSTHPAIKYRLPAESIDVIATTPTGGKVEVVIVGTVASMRVGQCFPAGTRVLEELPTGPIDPQTKQKTMVWIPIGEQDAPPEPN